ncbi:MAG: flagellar basal-body MS-ring/collar protein FliF [Hypericibacter sp.]
MKLPAWWEERGSAERWALGLGVPAFAAVLLVSAFLVFRPSYEVLFSGLAPQDLTNVANQLATQRIPYRMDEEGGRILVERKDVHDARVRVMEAGIPLSRPVGFELFDNVDFGMTEFTQRINYQRALEGELTRTISSLREIDHVRLHLVLPESSLFGSSASQPKAALTLALRPGMNLSRERIAGIQRLIASAVPGLAPEEVAIHDDKGASLVGDGQNSGVVAVTARIEAKKATEAYLAQKAQLVLDRAFGPGSAVVIVDADLDQDVRQFVRDEVIPVRGGATGAVTSLRSLHGILGRVAEDPTGEDAVAEASRTNPRGDITTEVKYEPGRQHETVAVAQGALKRLTVSVLVPRGTRDEVRLAMSAAVGNAIGVNIERGDAVSLQELPQASTPSGDALAVDQNRDVDEISGPYSARSIHGLLTSPLAWITGAVLALFLLAIGYMLAGRRPPPRLKAQELERLRHDIRRWIEEAEGPEVAP